MHYVFFLDRSVAFEAFKGDQVDVRILPGSVEWVTQYDIPAVRSGRIIKETFYTKDVQRMQAFVFNPRRPKFSDIRVRQAFNLAYDFETQMKVQSHGNFNKRLQSFFANSEMAATGQKQWDGLLLTHRHQCARLEVSSTSQEREGVQDEDYPRWGRFGKERVSGSRCRSQ